MTQLRIELIETDRGYFSVIVGDRFVDMCGRDEALGVVAAVLFGGPDNVPPFVKTYVEWDAWEAMYRRPKGVPVKIAGLLTCNTWAASEPVLQERGR